MVEILPEGRKSSEKEETAAGSTLKTGDSETAATSVKQKSEPKSPVKALVKTPMKKDVKMTPKKEEPVEVDVKCEEEEENDEKPKPAEGSDHLVIFATEGDFLGFHCFSLLGRSPQIYTVCYCVTLKNQNINPCI